MERYKGPRFVTALVGLGLGAAVLAGCAEGQTTPPTPDEVESNIEYIQLNGVRDLQGDPVECVMYASDSQNTNHSKSWFAFSCDFNGTAQFPGEPAPVTTEG